MWYEMWYKSGALSASRMLNAIYIRGLGVVCGGRGIREQVMLVDVIKTIRAI